MTSTKHDYSKFLPSHISFKCHSCSLTTFQSLVDLCMLIQVICVQQNVCFAVYITRIYTPESAGDWGVFVEQL